MDTDENAAATRRIEEIFGTNASETNALFAVDDPTAVAKLAEEHVLMLRPERVPEIVRRPNPALGGRSVLETIALLGVVPVRAALDHLESYVPAPNSSEREK